MPTRKSSSTPKPGKKTAKLKAVPHVPPEGKGKPPKAKAVTKPGKKAPAHPQAASPRKPRGAAASEPVSRPTEATGATQRLMRAKPAAGLPDLPDDKLTLTEEAFLTEYLRNGENGTAAWIYSHPGTSPSLAAIYAHKLLRKGKVSTRLAAERARLTRTHEMDRDGLLQELLLIVRADPNELTQMRQVACGHCYAGAGGRGDALYVEPDPDCERCAGDGMAVPWYADTRKLSAQARALFAGVKTTKDGAQVLMHDKMAALDRIARILGAYKEDNEQQAKPVADVIRAFFGQIHGDRLPIAKAGANTEAAPAHPLVGG